MKLYGAHQHLVNADYVIILDRSAHTIKNAVVSVVASEVTGLEANDDKTKYMLMSRDQNARRSHNLEIYNSSFERVEDFKYMNNLKEPKFCSERY